MLKPVIISPFGFLEVEMEGVFWNALKLRQTHLGQPQKPSMPLMWGGPWANSSFE